MRSTTPILVGITLLALLFAGGCKQAEGDRCQLDSDCEDGLKCCFVDDQPTKGICKPDNKCNKVVTDGSVKEAGTTDFKVEASAKDLKTEAGKDQKTTDKAMPDKALPDKALPDKALPDKALPDKASTPDKSLVE